MKGLRHQFRLTAPYFAVFLTFFTATSAPLPNSMAILGDSASIGMLAKYERSEAINPLSHFKLIGGFLSLLATFDKEMLAAPNLSWADGMHSKVRGHAFRLNELNPRLKYRNFAKAGSFSFQVPTEQLEAVKKWSAKELQTELPDYLTLFVGANDLCQKEVSKIPSAKSYRRNISLLLEKILWSPNTHVLVLPLPRFENLRQNLASAKIMGALGAGIVSRCEDIWKLAPLCKTLTGEQSEPNKKALRQIIASYNRELNAEVEKQQRRWGDRIRIARSIRNIEIHENDVAIDCFHPNWRLQSKVAELSWSYTWWSKE